MVSVIEWRITGRCNEKCCYCYGPAKDVSPTRAQLLGIQQAITASPVPAVRLSGGEPLLVRDIANILSSLKAAGKTVILSTNGRRLQVLRPKLEASLDKLNLSIDGYDAATHAINGREEASFDHAMAALDDLARTPPAYVLKVGTVITSRNLGVPDLLKRMWEILYVYPVNRWKIYQYVPEGPVLDNSLRITDGQFRELEDQFRASIGHPAWGPSVEFSCASSRDGAYFIIEPRGEVIVPIGNGRKTTEVTIGNVLSDSFVDLLARWQTVGSNDNHEWNLFIGRKPAARPRPA